MKINTKQEYNFNQIILNNLIGIKNRLTLHVAVLNSMLSKEKYLKPRKVGEGKGSSYWIKGSNLIKYLNEKKNEEKNKGGEKTRKKGNKKS